jgi:uncharacterized membrane protein
MTYTNYNINGSSGSQLYKTAETLRNATPGSKDNHGKVQLTSELSALDEKLKVAIPIIEKQGRNGGMTPQEIGQVVQEITRKTEEAKKSLIEGINGFIDLDTANTQSAAEQMQMAQDEQFKAIKEPNLLAYRAWNGFENVA